MSVSQRVAVTFEVSAGTADELMAAAKEELARFAGEQHGIVQEIDVEPLLVQGTGQVALWVGRVQAVVYVYDEEEGS